MDHLPHKLGIKGLIIIQNNILIKILPFPNIKCLIIIIN